MRCITITTAYPRSESDVLVPWIVILLQRLRERGIVPQVFTSSYCGMKSTPTADIPVFRFRYFLRSYERLTHDMSVPEKLKKWPGYFIVLPFFLLFGMISAYRYARRVPCDIVHVHFPFPLALFGIAMQRANNKPLLYSCHGSEVNLARRNRLFGYLFKKLLQKAAAVVVNSSDVERKLCDFASAVPILVIPMGTGHDIKSRTQEIVTRDRVLYVGRLIELKGVRYLIESLRYHTFSLDIAGDGPLKEELEALARELGVADRVLFHGYCTGEVLERLFDSAFVFVLPSVIDASGFTEGLGTVLLEALEHGVPVVASHVGGIPDIVENEKTGLLVEPGNPEAIAGSIMRLARDVNLRNRLVLRGKMHIEKGFSWDVIARRYEETYRKVVCRDVI